MVDKQRQTKQLDSLVLAINRAQLSTSHRTAPHTNMQTYIKPNTAVTTIVTKSSSFQIVWKLDKMQTLNIIRRV
jgi:hypothetical protein